MEWLEAAGGGLGSGQALSGVALAKIKAADTDDVADPSSC